MGFGWFVVRVVGLMLVVVYGSCLLFAVGFPAGLVVIAGFSGLLWVLRFYGCYNIALFGVGGLDWLVIWAGFRLVDLGWICFWIRVV